MSRQIDEGALESVLERLRRTGFIEVFKPDTPRFLSIESINYLCSEIYQDAVAHGLWEGAEYETDAQMGNVMYHAARRIEDEVQELKQEGIRAARGKENGYSEELADVIIMALSIAGHFNIDIDAEVRRKMAINKERPWKHGKE